MIHVHEYYTWTMRIRHSPPYTQCTRLKTMHFVNYMEVRGPRVQSHPRFTQLLRFHKLMVVLFRLVLLATSWFSLLREPISEKLSCYFSWKRSKKYLTNSYQYGVEVGKRTNEKLEKIVGKLMGIQQFYEKKLNWNAEIFFTAFCCLLLNIF